MPTYTNISMKRTLFLKTKKSVVKRVAWFCFRRALRVSVVEGGQAVMPTSVPTLPPYLVWFRIEVELGKEGIAKQPLRKLCLLLK